jgi:YHS domain-containing protein
MKKPFLLLLSLALASCATKPPETAATPVSATDAKKGAKKAPKPKPYPLQTCLVTGDGLDDMDERVTTVHEGQTFEFCCKPCLKKFNKNPGKYLKALAKSTG